MKALSIRQPWAWLIVNGIKNIENREWPTNYRGPLLIHASKKWDQQGYEFILKVMDVWVPSKPHHVYGAIIGVVDLIDCVREHGSPWFFGPHGFVLENARKFKSPIQWRGQLGIFEVPNYVLPDTKCNVLKPSGATLR